MTNKYSIWYGGGRGDKAWDAEMIVKAKDIRSALDKADLLIKYEQAEIFAIELIE